MAEAITIANAKLTRLIPFFKRHALTLDVMSPEEHALVIALLMRHCQARLGLQMDAPTKQPKPTNPERAVAFFRELATYLEEMSGTDHTLIVNLLVQTWQRRAAIALDNIKAKAKAQEPKPEENAVVH